MASVGKYGKGGRRILIHSLIDGSRQTLYLGKCDKKTADGFGRMVDFLVAAKVSNQPITVELAKWLNGVADKLKDKLFKFGLIECPPKKGGKSSTLKVFLESHVLNRKDVKSASITVWSQACRNLLEYYGENRALSSITAGDAKAFKEWLVASKNKRNKSKIRLAPATVAKRVKLSRQFFERAVDLELISKNPFRKVKSPGANDSFEKTIVTRQTMEMLMRVASPDWQGILALARFGGLRNPSETLSLKWSQVHWDKKQIIVPSCKTEHHPGKGSRLIPLFPELVEPLQNLQELAPTGAEYVIPGDHRKKALGPRGWQNVNLRQGFRRLCTKAGLEPIPEAFKAMRATRATELSESWPLKTVSSWMGHDVTVFLRYYAQVTQGHFEKATATTVSCNTESNTLVTHSTTQQVTAGNSQDNEKVAVNPEGGSFCATSRLTQPLGAKGLNGPEGI